MKSLLAVSRWIFRPLLEQRARQLARLISAQLLPGERVLDVGCGSLAIGREVKKLVAVSWVGVDTIDYNGTDLEFRLYDGDTLPFPPEAFDFVILVFVLHHCDDPLAVMRQACRVARKGLIIIEDVVDGSRWGLRMARFHDYLANKLIEPGVALPYQFKTLAGWQGVFSACRLGITETVHLKTQPLTFVDQTLFVLRKE